MALAEIRDIMAMGLLAAGGYLAYDWYTKTSGTPDTGGITVPAPGIGTGTGTVYIPSPDVAYPTHEFHDTILDPVYDAGWNFAGWQRATFGEWFGW